MLGSIVNHLPWLCSCFTVSTQATGVKCTRIQYFLSALQISMQLTHVHIFLCKRIGSILGLHRIYPIHVYLMSLCVHLLICRSVVLISIHSLPFPPRLADWLLDRMAFYPHLLFHVSSERSKQLAELF